MPDYLELTVDKFTFKVATDRFYSREGVWVLPSASPSGVMVRIGLSDYLQQHSGDIAFVNVKPVGTALHAGDEFAEIETIKVNIGLASPVSGAVVQVNKAIELNPEFANQDPYGEAWLVELRTTDWEGAHPNLLDADAYFDLMKTEIADELKETS